MAFKFVAILALLSAASAGVVPQVYHQYAAAAPVAYVPHQPAVVKSVAYAPHPHAVLAQHEEQYFDAHPQYKYAYNVQDDLTGDSKSQTEQRDGDVVTGEYSLIDSDGFKRVVQYTADAVHGFNAVVNRIPVEHVRTAVVKAAIGPAVTSYAHAAAVAPAYHEHH